VKRHRAEAVTEYRHRSVGKGRLRSAIFPRKGEEGCAGRVKQQQVGSQKGRDIERKCRRRQDTGQHWQKSKKFWGAREPKKEMEAGTGRDLEKRGRDGPRHMTHHSSWL